MVPSEDDKTRVLASAGTAEADDATRITGSGPAATRIEPAPAPPAPAGGGTARTIKQRFVLQKVLGSGGMGAVYQAVDLRKQEANDRDPYVAIKLLNDDFRRHPDAFISLQREARKAQTLAHPNIVNVYDFDRDGDTVFMTMECLMGQPLDKLLRAHADTGLPKPQALAVLRDIGAALGYAHSHQIAHSDFKPGNVFVTDKGVAKVLDFGIARAVSGLGGEAGEGTLFDPGSLGALTPAYASLEMLKGEAPDPRDDVYALGCVTYELFAGRHPFDKKTALQAQTEKLRPARIKRLSRRQWRALEQALAFERPQRLASVDQLLAAFDKSRSPWLWVSAAAVLAGSLGAAFYFMAQSRVDQTDIKQLRAGVETEVKQQLAADEVDALLKEVEYDAKWSADFNNALAAYSKLLPAGAPGPAQRRAQAAALYLAEAARQRTAGQLDSAATLLNQAQQWGADTATEQAQLALAQQQHQADEQAAASARQQAAAAAEARAAEARAQAQQRAQAAQAQQAVADAEAAVTASLTCSADIDTHQVQLSLQGLQALSAERYTALRPEVGKRLAACVNTLMRTDPVAATQLRQRGLALLPGDPSLAAVKIDPCAAVPPGSGGRSLQNVCSDDLSGGGRGPRLVVVPADGGKSYAIGKYEVSGAEFGRFCRASGACDAKSFSGSLPARGVTPALAQKYVAWLSSQSGFHYEVPSYQQWLHAATATGAAPDPNRNCTINAKGLSKGGFAVPVTTGRANAWGLVNAAGNVRELTLDGGSPVAAGGGFNDPIERCVYATREDAGADPSETGLRVLRVLAGS